MGTSTTKPSSSCTPPSYHNYSIIQSIPAQNLHFIQHKITHEQYLLKQLTTNNIKQCHKILDNLTNLKLKLSDNKHVLPIKEFQMCSSQEYCGVFYKIYVLVQYPHRTLEDQVRERKIVAKGFVEGELWSVLASCVAALAHLQKNAIKHGCLKSNRIMLTSQGIIKLADPSLTNTVNNYQTVLRRNPINKHIYISPQQSKCLQQQLVIPEYNTYKSDVFTLGMIVLQAGLLQYQDQDCYRDQGFRLNWPGINTNIQRFSALYSEQIVSMVKFMLTKEQNQRPDWIFLQGRYAQASSAIKQATYQESDKKQLSSVQASDTFSIKSNVRRANFQSRPDILSNHNLQPSAHMFPNVSQPRTSLESQQGTASFGQPYIMGTMPQVGLGSFATNLTPVPQSMQRNSSQTILSRRTSQRSGRSRESQPVQSLPFYHSPLHSAYQNVGSQYTLPPLSPRASQSRLPIGRMALTMDSSLTAPMVPSMPPSFLPSLSPSLAPFPPLPLLQPSTPIISPSNIQQTRPLLNIFPSSTYQNRTKIDDNIIIVNKNQHQPAYNLNNAQLVKQVKITTTKTGQKKYIPSVLVQPSMYTQKMMVNGVNVGENSLYKELVGQQRGTSYSMPVQHQLQTDSVISNINYQHNTNQNISNINTNTNINTNSNSKINMGVQRRFQPFNQILGQGRSNGSSQQLQYVVERYPQGSRYEGQKLNGMRHGQGNFYYEDGGYYSGTWKQNKMQGFGRLYYQSNKLAYQGQWKDNHFDGKGVIYNQQPQYIKQGLDYRDLSNVDQFWVKYQGQIVNDEKQGYGKVYYSNQEIFQGMFRGGCVEGLGTYYCNNGQVVKGLWARDRKVQ